MGKRKPHRKVAVWKGMENNYNRCIKESEGTSANQTIPLEFDYEVVAWG